MSKPYQVEIHKNKSREKPESHNFSSIALALSFISEQIKDKEVACALYKNGVFKASFSYKIKMLNKIKNKQLRTQRKK